jgi:hypothetical protein
MNKITQSIGTQTSGLASAAQVYSGSDMSCVALPHLGTMVAPAFDLVCNMPVFERPSLPQQPEINVEDPQLQLGLIGLLNFDLSPDEPAEGDMERPLEYHRSAE